MTCNTWAITSNIVKQQTRYRHRQSFPKMYNIIYGKNIRVTFLAKYLEKGTDTPWGQDMISQRSTVTLRRALSQTLIVSLRHK